MQTRHVEKRVAQLRKLHPLLKQVYFNPDGRTVVIYRKSAWRKGDKLTKRGKSFRMKLVNEYRWTVYASNGWVVAASTEGYRNLKAALKNASMPTPIPPVPELGNGIYWTAKRGFVTG